MTLASRAKADAITARASIWTPEAYRIVRVIVRMGGTSADAAKHIGCTKNQASAAARRIGLSFTTACTGYRA